MSQGTVLQRESELISEFEKAPSGFAGTTRLALGKKPKAFNAMTHGLSGQNIILTASELPHWAQMGLDFMRELQPVGPREISSAQIIFEARWRLHRILSVENNMFSIPWPDADGSTIGPSGATRTREPGIAQQVNAFRQDAHNIDIIGRYETRLIRNSERVAIELDILQEKRLRKTEHLTFDEASSPAVIWYQKVLVRYAALAQARQEHEDEQNTAAELEQERDRQLLTKSASATSSEDLFGKIPPSLDDEPAETPAPEPAAQSKRRGYRHKSRKHGA